MKFSPGQKVLVLGEHKSNMTPEMSRFIGKIVTISKKHGGNIWPYRVVECDRWVWAEYMFIDSMDSNDPNIRFKMRKGG